MTTPRVSGGPVHWLVTGLALVTCLFALGSVAQTQGPRLDLPLSSQLSIPAEVCGTEFVYLQMLGLATPQELTDGQALMFDQVPAILRPDLTGNFLIRVQIVGDFATLQFLRWDPEATADNIETWNRTATRTVAGRIVSIYEKTYPDTELARILRRQAWGLDDGGLQWGQVLLPNSDTKQSLSLRIGSTNLPAAMPVVRLSPDVQYAGNVVNIRMPDFGDSRVMGGDHAFDLPAAARMFYEFFPDSYEMIAFIPQNAALSGYAGFHRHVKNEVTGIGLPLFNTAPEYGSGGTLQGVEVYPQTAFTSHSASSHEMSHQWGHYMGLTALAGVEPKGHQPEAHTPLTRGATLLGAVLWGTRQVVPSADAVSFEIGQTAFPIVQHPLEMYVMGKLSPEALGTQTIFDDQGQFDPAAAATPDVGTKLKGGVKDVTVGAILGRHGARGGPIPIEIRRATVLVSRDALASDAEMSYWNFFAQRLADPNRTGVPSYEGYVSFDRTTQNSIDLRTDVTPKTGGAPGVPVDVTTPRFGRRDWRGVEFDDNVPSRFAAGQRVTLAGRITAGDRTDFSDILIRFSKYGDSPDNAVRAWGTVTRSGTFTVDIDFTQGQKGLYAVGLYLFWPDSGSQFPRGVLTPILVE